jgi:tetratricopeptide (TPR) repeat protein
MSEADDLFSQAYELAVVEEQPHKAIELCKRALVLDPDNYRIRVYLGTLLADSGTPEEKKSARDEFIAAIMRSGNADVLCDTLFEESAIHNLGIWEWNEHHQLAACLFFLADFMACKSERSHSHLIKILEEIDSALAADIEVVLAKVIPPESHQSYHQ